MSRFGYVSAAAFCHRDLRLNLITNNWFIPIFLVEFFHCMRLCIKHRILIPEIQEIELCSLDNDIVLSRKHVHWNDFQYSLIILFGPADRRHLGDLKKSNEQNIYYYLVNFTLETSKKKYFLFTKRHKLSIKYGMILSI